MTTSSMSDIRALTCIEPIRSLLTACALPVSDVSDTPAIQFYGMHSQEKLMGVIGLEIRGDVGLLRSLAVDNACRDRGLGRQLVAHLESMACRKNLRALYLLTTTAASYFEHLGFTRVARTDAPAPIQSSTQFSGLCPTSSILLCKPIQ